MVNLVPVPKVTGMAELVFAVMAEWVTSELVRVALPPFLRVTPKVRVPLLSEALAGNVALLSLEAMATVSLVTIKFHEASTALTVTLKAAQALCAVGAPVLPVLVPGAAVSPGMSTCSLANAPALTVMGGLVLPVMAALVTSEAVNVALPAVLKLTLKVWVPPLNAALAGKAALASLELIWTASAALARFQKASTALTVTVNGMPAVHAVGVPVLPALVPGAAISPGASNCNLARAAGLTTMLLEAALVKPLAVKLMVRVSATLYDRLVKVATPLTAVADTAP